jgi:light-regulated signal transduction histidine kinase (bacteriophytochrome)
MRTDLVKSVHIFPLSPRSARCGRRTAYGGTAAPAHAPAGRSQAGKRRAEGGTGLGPAIVKHILARHQGRLAIESTFGEGATFTVHLPLAEQTVAPERKAI